MVTDTHQGIEASFLTNRQFDTVSPGTYNLGATAIEWRQIDSSGGTALNIIPATLLYGADPVKPLISWGITASKDYSRIKAASRLPWALQEHVFRRIDPLTRDASFPDLPPWYTTHNLLTDMLRCVSTHIIGELPMGSQSIKGVRCCFVLPQHWGPEERELISSAAIDAGLSQSSFDAIVPLSSMFQAHFVTASEATCVFLSAVASALPQADVLCASL